MKDDEVARVVVEWAFCLDKELGPGSVTQRQRPPPRVNKGTGGRSTSGGMEAARFGEEIGQ